MWKDEQREGVEMYSQSILFYVVKHVKILFFSHCKVIIKHELTPHAHIYFSCTHLFHDNCTGERNKESYSL